MKRALFCLLGLAAAAFGQQDVVVKAMHDELSRSMAQLHMENLEKPYFIGYWIEDTEAASVSATLGQLTASNLGRARMLAVQVRVGDYRLDNTNFLSGRPAAGLRALPLDDDYDQLRREIWLATDAEYKNAGAALAAKHSALNGRTLSATSSALPDFTRQEPVTVNEPGTPVKIDAPALEQLARDVSAVFRGAPEILGSGVQITVANVTRRMLNSEGASTTGVTAGVLLQVSARTQAPDGAPLEDSFHVYGRSLDVLRGDGLLAQARALVTRLKALRTATPVLAYNGPVLFEDEAAAQVVAQVLAPAVTAMRIPISADPQVENQIQQVFDQFGVSLADKVGARVLPSSFDVTDNPLLKTFGGVPTVGSHTVDVEGVPAREVKLVGNGWLVALLATRAPTAQAGNSTGSANVPGTAAPSNLLLTAGKAKTGAELRQELVRSAKERGLKFGIVVRHVGTAR
jgi:predicted Zn-dependent protease